MKVCSKCKSIKEETQFYFDSNRQRFRPECKECDRIYYEANREKINARTKNWKLNYPEKVIAERRSWIVANPDKKRIMNKRWRLNNIEKEAANQKRWRQANLDKRLAIEQRRRARKMNVALNDFTVEDWQDLLFIYDHRCAYCRTDKKKLTQDHVIPISRGGDYTIENIVPACHSCNSSKGKKTVEEWRTARAN